MCIKVKGGNLLTKRAWAVATLSALILFGCGSNKPVQTTAAAKNETIAAETTELENNTTAQTTRAPETEESKMQEVPEYGTYMLNSSTFTDGSSVKFGKDLPAGMCYCTTDGAGSISIQSKEGSTTYRVGDNKENGENEYVREIFNFAKDEKIILKGTGSSGLTVTLDFPGDGVIERDETNSND